LYTRCCYQLPTAYHWNVLRKSDMPEASIHASATAGLTPLRRSTDTLLSLMRGLDTRTFRVCINTKACQVCGNNVTHSQRVHLPWAAREYYHYQHAWDRVQHAPAVVRPMYCPSHYSVGVSDRQAYGVDGPDDPWSASTRGVIGPNMHGANAVNAPRAPAPSARMSQYTPEYSTAAGTAAHQYSDAGSAYQSGLVGQLSEHAYRNPSNVQQQVAPPTLHPSGHNASLGGAGGELEDMYHSTMQQVTVWDMCRYICVCICGRYWWQAGRYLLLYHAVGI